MPFSWSTPLRLVLSSPAGQPDPRVAFVGIGNEFKSDDCAGPFIARRLNTRLAPREDLLVLDAGTAPENITGTLRRFAPDWVILMDAVDLGKPAGAVEWLSLDMVEGMDAFTHGLPPLLFGQFLKSELGCQVGLIGVQPASLAFDHPVHPAVRASIAKIARKLISLFS